MKIDVDPKALREFTVLLQEWSQIDKDDPDDTNWADTTEKTMALMAMSEDMLALLGEPVEPRTERYSEYLAKNKYYRPMTSP